MLSFSGLSAWTSKYEAVGNRNVYRMTFEPPAACYTCTCQQRYYISPSDDATSRCWVIVGCVHDVHPCGETTRVITAEDGWFVELNLNVNQHYFARRCGRDNIFSSRREATSYFIVKKKKTDFLLSVSLYFWLSSFFSFFYLLCVRFLFTCRHFYNSYRIHMLP